MSCLRHIVYKIAAWLLGELSGLASNLDLLAPRPGRLMNGVWVTHKFTPSNLLSPEVLVTGAVFSSQDSHAVLVSQISMYTYGAEVTYLLKIVIYVQCSYP